MRNNVLVPQRSSGHTWVEELPVFFFKVIGIVSSLMIMMNKLAVVTVTASEIFSDIHVRSMTLIDQEKELTIPVFVASFGDPIVFPKGANLMYPPIDDDGYLCNLPPSFQSVHAWNKTTRYTGGLYSIGLFVKYGGNCTAQRKAEVVSEIQQYFPNVDMLLIYGTAPPAEFYDYDHQPTLLLPDTDPVPEELVCMSILYVKYNDALKIINEIAAQEKIDENKSANFNPNPHSTNSSTRWTFNFIVSGLPRDDSGYYDNNRNGIDSDDENPINFFWFRFVLFGLLIIAPCIRALYLWYAGGGRIYFRRSEQTGRIIGLQYIPPIATWLAIGPTRLQQPSTPIRDVISEEDFNNLPEIIYTAPINTTKHDVEEQAPIVSARSGKAPDPPADRDTSESNDLDPLADIINVNNSIHHQQESLNTSFNSTAEKGFIDIVDGDDDKAIPTTIHSDNDNALSVSNIDEDLAHATTPSIATTTCTTCSICIDDFIIGETLTFLPRYVLTVAL